MCLRTKCEAGQTERLRPTLEANGYSSSIAMELYGDPGDIGEAFREPDVSECLQAKKEENLSKS
jgi:hypothetical protein